MHLKFSCWDILFFQYIKRDWKKIMIWLGGISFFSVGFLPAFKEMASGQGMTGLYETLQNPAMVSMIGPTPVEASAYTLGAMFTHQMLIFCVLLSMIVSALHVIGHTRREEDLGLVELLRSFRIGRQANSFAVIVEVMLINLALALIIAFSLFLTGGDVLSLNGSLLFGASIGLAGWFGATLALVAAQVMPTAAGAKGMTLGLIGAFYLIRAGTDVSNVELSMLNPLGWTYLTYPFTENDGRPLFYLVSFSLFMLFLAFVLENGRDVGAGYLPERQGRDRAKRSLLSVHGLFLRINRGVSISWLVTFMVMGAAYGSIYGDMQSFIEGNEAIQAMFSYTGVSIEESFTGMIMMIMMVLVSILPIAIVNRLFHEEARLHLSQLFATKISRNQLYWTTVGLAIGAGVLGTIAVAGSLAATAISVMGENPSIGWADFFLAGFNYFPAVLFFIGLASITIGWMPRFGKVIYIYLAYAFSINYFGGIIELPTWLEYTAVQSWIPQLPIESFDATVFISLTCLAIVLLFIGMFGYRRRDLSEGA